MFFVQAKAIKKQILMIKYHKRLMKEDISTDVCQSFGGMNLLCTLSYLKL